MTRAGWVLSRPLVMFVSGAVGCLAYGGWGLAFPMLFAVLWLAEMGALA